MRQGLDGPPYDELDRQWEATRPALLNGGAAPGAARSSPPSSPTRSRAPSPRLRWPVGADAELALGTQDSMSFEDFEATMRGLLGLTW